MSRIIYNVEGLFVGPSGNNFLNYAGGDSHNDYSDTVINDNLIKQLDRVQALSYDISIPHHQVAIDMSELLIPKTPHSSFNLGL